MPVAVQQVKGEEETSLRVSIDRLDGGWSTRSVPHLLPDNYLAVADNVIFNQDGLVAKRPGNETYGGGSGNTGSNAAIFSMTRFYFGQPPSGQLILHSGAHLYKGNDNTGAFTAINAAMSASVGATFAQMYDPDNTNGAATTLFICDGSRVPQTWDGTNFSPVQTAAGFLPKSDVSGASITPLYCSEWGNHLVYAGEPTDPTAIYISDALRPERFTGFGFVDSQGTPYVAYFPDARSGKFGVITGIVALGPVLIIFYTAGIIGAINTGSYGAFQYQFYRISSSVGAVSPRSIVAFDNHVVFFGGDAFYATDGTYVLRLPDELPTVYSVTAQSGIPRLIKNPATVFGVRRSTMYLASYDSTGTGPLDQIVMFDTAAQGGWTFGQPRGGAWARWLGMPIRAAVECRGPGDSFQFFWGSSKGDLVGQHDTGTYDDFGNAYSIELRTKSFFFETPAGKKIVGALYPILVYPTSTGGFTSTVTPYVLFDQAPLVYCTPLNITLTFSGTEYGTAEYGTFLYESGQAVIQVTPKGFPQTVAMNQQGFSVACGLLETSKHPVACIGFVLEAILEPPQP